MWVGNVLDELVEVAPGYYLGKAHLRTLTCLWCDYPGLLWRRQNGDTVAALCDSAGRAQRHVLY
jgi:hypothetical protein